MTYWKPEPQRHGFAWWALLIPAVIYSVGVIVYAHNAFVPDAGQNGHAVGSALMVIGGESGTLAAASEVFRKQKEGRTTALDWLGMFVSLIATLGNLFVVYVALAALQTPWTGFVREYGPLILLLCSGLDFYAGIMEFGFYNANFDEVRAAWDLGRHNAALRKKRESTELYNAPTVQAQGVDKSTPVDIEPTPEVTIPQSVKPQSTVELDELAMQILQVYTEDPEITKSALARRVQVSRPTVNDRLEKLRAAGKLPSPVAPYIEEATT